MQNSGFSRNRRRFDADEMLDQAMQLKALGQVISALACHQDDALHIAGQELGGLISALSENVKKAIETAFPALMDAFKSDDGSLEWELKQELARLKSAEPAPHIAILANKNLLKIEEFLSQVKIISELKAEFLKVREAAFTGNSRLGAVVNE